MHLNLSSKLPETLSLPAGEVLTCSLADAGHWYGHGFNHELPYPLDTGELQTDTFSVNNIQSPVWMASCGVVLVAATRAVLTVRLNAKGDGLFQVSCPEEDIVVRVYQADTLKEAHQAFLLDAGWPNAPVSSELFGDSFFCTWTQYPRCITQERVVDMARQIRANGFPCTRLILDDRWERCFGELVFDPVAFPDPRGMFEELKAMGFEAWLWVTPFVNEEAEGFAELGSNGVLVPDVDGTGAATFRWWGGTAGLVDVTGDLGRNWYRERLSALMDLGAEGFKIDGGDYKYQPSAVSADWADPPGASGYSDQLLEVFEDLVPGRCETRTAWMSQSRNILWRQGGKDSHWGADNGLKAMLRLGLHLSLLGYDQQIPDMVPGRVQTMNASDPLPSDELMVRWTEVSAFFPMLQFSYFPWNYEQTTSAILAGFARVHKALEAYVYGNAFARKAPLIRPLWYEDPTPESFRADDQFFLGSDLLIAPVLDEGVSSRDVLLPPGEWIDAWTGERVQGRLKAYPAPCPGIPLFVRERNSELAELLHHALKDIPRGIVSSGVTTAVWQAGLDRDLSVTG